MATKTTKQTIRGSVAIYGTHKNGHGYISIVDDGASKGKMFGDGDPREGVSATDVLFKAIPELRAAGVNGDIAVSIDVDGRPLVAIVKPGLVPYFGDLKFGSGLSVTISAQEIERAHTDALIASINASVNARR